MDELMDELTEVKRLLQEGDTGEAIRQLDALIAAAPEASDELYYLRGNAYRKQSNWQMALGNYLQAIDINPQSPARAARDMLMDILEFYNKDMYNQ